MTLLESTITCPRCGTVKAEPDFGDVQAKMAQSGSGTMRSLVTLSRIAMGELGVGTDILWT
jgi:hypothetical protein